MYSNWAAANFLIQEKLVYVHDFTQDTPSDSQAVNHWGTTKQTAGAGVTEIFVFLRGQQDWAGSWEGSQKGNS